MMRAKELAFRIANAALIGATLKLHRAFGAPTTYRVGAEGSAALFEDCWFRYSPREFGSTGNLDLSQEAENETRQALFAQVKDGQVFYDIGAHGGVFTITLLKRFPNLQIHAFEPQPDDLLCNLRLNSMPTDIVHRLAVGEKTGTVRMTTKNRSSNHVSESGALSVPMVRLDDLDLPPPDWIKIDIEGLELPALRGAESLLRKSHPTIICEINHLFDRYGTTIPEFLAFMRSLGYTPHRLVSGELESIPDAQSLSDLGYSADNNFWFR